MSRYINSSYSRKVEFLRKKGAEIGNNVIMNCQTSAFGTEPYLISVGNDCLFACGLKINTHDGAVSVLNNLNYFDGKRMDKMARVKIGNNVYTGTDVTIMPGVTIGDNCIIGSGAVVTRDIPSNSVAVGVPAKVVKTIDEYYQSALERGLFYPTKGMPYEEKKQYLSENVKKL